MKTITLRVDDQVHREIKTVAAQTDQSMQAVVMEALRTCEAVGETLKRMEQGQSS